MAVWMDLTNSMYAWKGGVVGIVRAELEIARNMKKNAPDTRFFRYDGTRFQEILEHELDWLWDCGSIGDAYLKAMGRTQNAGTAQDDSAKMTVAARERYPGLENAYRYSSSRLHRALWGLLLYADTLPGILRPITKKAIAFFSWPLKKISLRRAQRRARNEACSSAPNIVSSFSHPFHDGDVVFSCGWMLSGKESGFERVKTELPSLFLVYLIYDIILVKPETKQFYQSYGSNSFKEYINWISFHCDALFYGGKTAMNDTQAYQKEHYLPVPPGYPVYFGSDVLHVNTGETGQDFFKEVGITGPYILTVGSIDARKNYSTLYRAWTILVDSGFDSCPQLIIVGKGNACGNLLDSLARDERTKNRILRLSPSDEELDLLYKKALFVVLPSAWEGWSLTLPEALNYGKLVIASDVEPLREIGRDMVAYADTFDPFDWAGKIKHFVTHPRERAAYEEKLRKEWQALTWEDCGRQVSHLLSSFSAGVGKDRKPTIFIDISTSWTVALSDGNISGIVRAELELLKHLYCKYDHVRIFALSGRYGYIPIDVSCVVPILTGDQLDADFAAVKDALRGMMTHFFQNTNASVSRPDRFENRKTAFWHLASVLPPNMQKRFIAYGERVKRRNVALSMESLPQKASDKAYTLPFRKGDIVFTAGTGSDADTYKGLLEAKAKIGYLYCPVIYDLTPILLPQVHQKATVEHCGPFLEFTSKMADFIFYGGETAQKDGIAYQKKHGLPQPPSTAIKFGSDIIKTTREDIDEEQDHTILKNLGIKGPFIMTVGTIEIRKNHETLYRAYLRMLEQYDDVPQMVFAGHPGWKVNDFMEVLGCDDRVKGKILYLSPSDELLDTLYRHCSFTILASLYEGWSLTLPESFWYGKFCLCCNTPALKETAGDLSEYIHAWDEKKWAERIYYYHSHPDVIRKRETDIKKQWKPISWDECAEDIMSHLRRLIERG